MFKSRKVMALFGFIVGAAMMYIITYFAPPTRINYAFVVDDNAFMWIQIRWWLSIIAVGAVGAAVGWLIADVSNRKR